MIPTPRSFHVVERNNHLNTPAFIFELGIPAQTEPHGV